MKDRKAFQRSAFTSNWLEMRESVDRSARRLDLCRRWAELLPQRARVIELAAGNGALLRAMLPFLRGNLEWFAWDRDAVLLAQIPERLQNLAVSIAPSGHGFQIETLHCRITLHLQEMDLAIGNGDLYHHLKHIKPDGIAASAWFDLASPEWITHFCRSLVEAGRPTILATLTIDGRVKLYPFDAADQLFLRLYHRNMETDKGTGQAAGIHAPTILHRQLQSSGYTICTRHSDWRLSSRETPILDYWLKELCLELDQILPGDKKRFNLWRATRLAQLKNRRLSVRVGHQDLLGWRS